MDVTFIGSGDAFGSGGRYQTCIRVRAPQATLLVDCGATSLSAMKSQNVDPGAIDAVVVTHLHGDHFGGLPFLVLDGQFSRRTQPLHVFGPAGTRARLLSAMEVLYPGSSRVDRRFRLDVDELDGAGTPVDVLGLSVRSWEVNHPSGAPALALRVETEGRAFAYSGDTAWTDVLPTAARGTDLFACESYTYDRQVKYHLNYATVDARAPSFETAQLVLTHMGPDMLRHIDEVGRQTALDGLEIQL